MECADFLILLGKRIKTLRKAQDMSQERFAELAGLSVVFVSNLENGRRRASICTYMELAGALGMSLSELVELPGEKESWDENLLELFQAAKQLGSEKQRLFVEAAKGLLLGLDGR